MAQLKDGSMGYESNPGLRDLWGKLYQSSQDDGKGDFYDMLGKLLSQTIQNGDPNMNEYREQMNRSVNQSFNASDKRLQEDFASRGMGGSGASLAARTQLGGERYNALAQGNMGLSQMDYGTKMNALSQLLGLNSQGIAANQNQFSNLFNMYGAKQSQANWEKDFKYREDNTPDPWGEFFGGIVQGGSQIGLASLLL